MDKIEIGKRIKKYRTERGITKHDLAGKAGISPSYIHSIEKGEKCPTVEVISEICDSLGITLSSFFSEKTDGADKVSALSEHQKRLLNEFLSSL